LHWPNRSTPHFGKHWAGMTDSTLFDKKQEEDGLLDILTALGDLVKEGKIRHVGLSDDTPWGISKYLELAKDHNLPRMVSIQNEYSFIHQKDDPYLTEMCVMEDVAYLPWSPLGTGALSGKYIGGARPEGARWTIPQRNGPFRDTENVDACVRAFVDIAKEHDLDPAQMALAWCDQKPFVTSTIIGATSMTQLKSDIAAFDIVLPSQVIEKLDKLYRKYPIPF
ncbi:MAG: aldo/keto reductase, partial [Bdellovibrionales bacterium]